MDLKKNNRHQGYVRICILLVVFVLGFICTTTLIVKAKAKITVATIKTYKITLISHNNETTKIWTNCTNLRRKDRWVTFRTYNGKFVDLTCNYLVEEE